MKKRKVKHYLNKIILIERKKEEEAAKKAEEERLEKERLEQLRCKIYSYNKS
ncbi:MAG: hypothetical protein MJ252_09610 [archaeon]|nr:hypothetical protein [archaeon]